MLFVSQKCAKPVVIQKRKSKALRHIIFPFIHQGEYDFCFAKICLTCGYSKKKEQGSFFLFVTLVSREGLEPSTPGLKGPCSNLLSYRPKFSRIVDNTEADSENDSVFCTPIGVVGDTGVEPVTSSTSKTRSSQLS